MRSKFNNLLFCDSICEIDDIDDLVSSKLFICILESIKSDDVDFVRNISFSSVSNF